MAHASATVIEHRKVYVEVTVKVSPEGEVRPLSITFEDGIRYEIDRLKQRCRAHATKVGGTGIRYTIVVNNHETYLFEDDGRWFVEAKTHSGGYGGNNRVLLPHLPVIYRVALLFLLISKS